MKMLTGFIAPTSGIAELNGISVTAEPIRAQKRLGYLPENAPLYPEMTVISYLDYIARIRGLGRSERTFAVDKVAETCGLTRRLNQPIGELSKGYRQRVGLAQALVHDPPILILDEPTTGLDPNQIVEIRHLIKAIGTEKTVLLSTHILSEVEASCDRVLILHQGKLAADGDVESIAVQHRGGQRYLVCYGETAITVSDAELETSLKQVQGLIRCRALTSEPHEHRFELISSRDIRAELFQLACAKGLVLLELSRDAGALEDVFRELTETL